MTTWVRRLVCAIHTQFHGSSAVITHTVDAEIGVRSDKVTTESVIAPSCRKKRRISNSEMSVSCNLGRTPWCSTTFSYQRLFANAVVPFPCVFIQSLASRTATPVLRELPEAMRQRDGAEIFCWTASRACLRPVQISPRPDRKTCRRRPAAEACRANSPIAGQYQPGTSMGRSQACVHWGRVASGTQRSRTFFPLDRYRRPLCGHQSAARRCRHLPGGGVHGPGPSAARMLGTNAAGSSKR